MTKRLGVTWARNLAEEIQRECPRKTNPRQGGSCVYEKGERRCFIGEMVRREGLPLEMVQDEWGQVKSAGWVALQNHWPVTKEARLYLERLQEEADSRKPNDVPLRWGDIDLDKVYTDYLTERARLKKVIR